MKAADLPTDYNMCEILEHNLKNRSDKTALYSEYGPVTFREVSDQVNKVGNALTRLGIGFGECVAILCPDRPEWVSTFFATAKIGGVALGMNTMLSTEEYDYIFKDARVSVLVICENLLSLVEPILSNHKMLTKVIVMEQKKMRITLPLPTGLMMKTLNLKLHRHTVTTFVHYIILVAQRGCQRVSYMHIKTTH